MSKYKFDEMFFSEPKIINTYWAGFIAADGNVAMNRNTVSIDLASKDRNHLVLFKKDVCGDFKIEDRKRPLKGCFSRVRVDCSKWKQDLKLNYNIVPQKSLTLNPPNGLDYALSLCYISGYIDGDGSISSDGYIKIVGTRQLLEWTKSFFDSLFPSDLVNRQCNIRNITDLTCEYTIGGHRSRRIKNIVNSLPLPTLDRKWRK